MSWWSRGSGGSHTMLSLARMWRQKPEGFGHAALPHIQLAGALQDEHHLGERLCVLVVPCSAGACRLVPAQHHCRHLPLPRAQTGIQGDLSPITVCLLSANPACRSDSGAQWG